MNPYNHSLLVFILCLPCLICGCVTTQTQTQTAANIQSAPTSDSPDTTTSQTSVTLKAADIPEFASRVQWPDFSPDTADKPIYTIESGISDGVWVEAKGYFHIPIENIYQDFIDVQIMGPTYLTNDIVQKNLVQNPLLTTYVMDIKMRYIMSVEFSIGVRIEAFYDADGNINGYIYKSNKSDGTRFITTIDEQLVVRYIKDNWFSVEFQSINVATMNKEKETRKHIESLFERWEKLSKENLLQ